ncbi:MAG: sialidase family protein [Candidatus Tyrphobacter sp.]
MIARALAAACSALILCAALPGARAPWRIFVGPNVRVSADSEKSHFEPMIAASANGVLLASTNLTGGDDNAWVTKGYVSTDSGNTWYSVLFPRLLTSHPGDFLVSGDAAVAAGASGRLFFAALCPLAPGAHVLVTCLYRSDDRGASWLGTTLQIGDHERFVTDPANGFVLIAGKWSGKEDRLVFFVSHNNGTTFSGPHTFARGLGIALDPCRLSDGTVFIPFVDEQKKHVYYDGVLVSPSLHVSAPFRLYDTPQTPYSELAAQRARSTIAGRFADDVIPVFVTDGARIYAFDGADRGGTQRLILRVSLDRGRRWSAARVVAAPRRQGVAQFAPAAAVSRGGIVGVSWSEMSGRTTYDERFSASLDHGATFLPARVISTGKSAPFNDENVAGQPQAFGGSFMQFSGFTTRSSGGDYFGMAADGDGVFHPLWIDSRDGIGGQLYTASVAIARQMDACSEEPDAHDIMKNVAFAFDPPRMNVATGVLTIPVRLRNIGSVPLRAPLTLTITKLHADENIAPTYRVPPNDSPVIINASNGDAGAGATFDFSHTLGDLPALAPGAVTNAVDIEIRLHNALMAEPVLSATVAGGRCAP